MVASTAVSPLLGFGDPADPLGGAAGAAERERIAQQWSDETTWRDPNNRRLSDRLWSARRTDRDAIDAILRESIARGDDPLLTAERLEAYLTPAGRKTTTELPRPASGRENATGNHAARTLARTETTRAFGLAGLQANALNPFVRGSKWNKSNRHRGDDVCDRNAARDSGLGPGVYRHGEFPSYPGHPNCICFETPVVVEDTDAVIAQLRREYALAPVGGPAVLTPIRGSDLERVATLFRVARAFLGRAA